MHLLIRETRSLEQDEEAVDLDQSPAEIVFLSFSDSDLGAVASAWENESASLPGMRLANLARLRHPMSIDLYVEQVIENARCVIVRLLGGLEYWRYGAEELSKTCRRLSIPLVLLPGDEHDDTRLSDLSTVGPDARARLSDFLREGGPANTADALELAAHLAGFGPDHGRTAAALPQFGLQDFGPRLPDHPNAAIVFYRSYLLAGDTAPIAALSKELRAQGLDTRAIFVSSLKNPEAARFVTETLEAWAPTVVLNATGFSARLGDSRSPLDAAGVPVLQLVLAGSDQVAWQESSRGLSQADLAMQVVLPELDGRLSTAAISFKQEAKPVAGLEFARSNHAPVDFGIEMAAARAAAWANLAGTSAAKRRVALILSDYPGTAGQAAHAVGLDALASTAEILNRLRDCGYQVGDVPAAAGFAKLLCDAAPQPFLSLKEYEALFSDLPEATRVQVTAAWGEPDADPAFQNGAMHMRFVRQGNFLIAVQPDRGGRQDRKANYHDPDLPPRHGYIAFYLWLQKYENIDAMIHLGTHGTLEWLPGKAVALSESCFPLILMGAVPVIYPFIVNNPGEAAAAKRRLGAVTIGHLTPPLMTAGVHGASAELEKLIDEFAAADGLDRRRTALLRREILQRAETEGILEESGATGDMDDDDALAHLDAHLCDVKDMQIRDGLHIFGCAPEQTRRRQLEEALKLSCPSIEPDELLARLDQSPDQEFKSLVNALDGKFVEPGPAGAPTRGRADVLPTGRNIFTVDPRAIPNRSAMMLAENSADELLRRYRQDHGEWPKAMVIDLWGSATMRTGGEDLALALLLMGVKPVWDHGSARVTGVEVMALAELDRPRVDVTIRISGLFRDAFETQIGLFDTAVQAVASQDEPEDMNPLAVSMRGNADTPPVRIYGAAPMTYGAGVTDQLARGGWSTAQELGDDYVDASGFAYGHGRGGEEDRAGFAARIKDADAFVHQQDHRETDILDSLDYAAHEGGFAAAAAAVGNAPALYHNDISVPENPKTRTIAEEIRRVVRGRTANPKWIRGMMPHGYQGAGEIARGLDGLYGFAATLPERFDRQFDQMYDATLGDPEVDEYLETANPAARDSMARRFDEAVQRGIWQPRRNSVLQQLQAIRS